MAALGLSFVVFGLCQESCVEKRLQRDHNPPQETMRQLVEAVAPARMGTGFRWLLSAEWFNNLGDGMALAAGPLLIASQTRNPTLVALATIMQRAPWFLFGLYAGWIADRFDRRLMVAIADAFRGVVLVGLAAVIATGEVNVPLVLVAMFLLGTAETFADTAAGTLMPILVTPRDLGVANARVSFGRRALNELVGPPLGAALFIGGLAVPFMVQAVMVRVGAVLVSRIAVGVPADLEVSRGIRTDVREGVLWLWRNPPVRTLTLTIVLFNLTFGAMWPMLVLYSDERLGLGEFGFGLLLSASAVGGVLGAMSYGWLEQRIALGTLMRSALLYETCMHLGLGLSTVPVISMAMLFGFGFQTSIWGTTATAVRQRAVPENFQGRVGSAYMVALFGALVVGGTVGAAVAGIWGVLAPFWFGFVGSALSLAIIWRQLPKVAHADAQIVAASTDG